MNLQRRILPAFVFCALGLAASAQTGMSDQVSPASNAGFNGDAVSLTWQAQVQAGLTGTLEGFTLVVTGNQGASLDVGIRIGAGWNTTPLVFQTTIVKPTSTTDNVFVDTTSAHIQVVPGTLFVIEMTGTGTGLGLSGSYVAPPGAPLYSEPLYLNGPGCYADCGWRLAFTTWVQTNSGLTFCSGDGSGTACPCGNAGTANNGCSSSVSPNGAHLAVSGSASISSDTLTISGSDMPNSSALYFQGTLRMNGGAGVVFGDGLRCAGGTITRLGTKTNAAGQSAYPVGADTPISIRGGDSAGVVRDYQCWYRNAAAFCTPSTFNLTNGVEVTWAP